MKKLAGFTLGMIVMSFGAYAGTISHERLSSDRLGNEAENVCSPVYREPASKPDYDYKKSAAMFGEDVLKAYQKVVKTHPGIEKLDVDPLNEDVCKANVITQYNLDHIAKG